MSSPKNCCPICLEKIRPAAGDIGSYSDGSTPQHQNHVTVTFRGCGHDFCKPCIEKWFLRLENGRYELGDTPITCPECRSLVQDEDALAVLGRPLQTFSQQAQQQELRGDGNDGDGDNDHEEMDEFTRTYMEEQGARQCPDCGVWIIREDGCENIKCRCGCRFCICCGRKGNSCAGGGVFYDNVLGEEEKYDYDWDPDTESVAGLIVPLFDADLEYFEYNWYDYWVELTEEGEDSNLIPLFHGGDWWYDLWFERRL